jgi:hypothetical protein
VSTSLTCKSKWTEEKEEGWEEEEVVDFEILKTLSTTALLRRTYVLQIDEASPNTIIITHRD